MQIMADPTAAIISKTMAKRKLLELSGLELDDQLIYATSSWEEMAAMEKLPLLNNNDILGAKIDPEEMNADQQTFITIFGQALPTPATKAAIQARKDLMIQQGKI